MNRYVTAIISFGIGLAFACALALGAAPEARAQGRQPGAQLLPPTPTPTPTPPPAEVRVANTEQAPALVRNVDEGPKRPYQVEVTINLSGDATGVITDPEPPKVPKKKRFVIEYVSGEIRISTHGQGVPLRHRPVSATFTTRLGPGLLASEATHYLTVGPQQGPRTVQPFLQPTMDNYYFALSQPMRVYANGDTPIVTTILIGGLTLDPVYLGYAKLTFSGYLVDE